MVNLYVSLIVLYGPNILLVIILKVSVKMLLDKISSGIGAVSGLLFTMCVDCIQWDEALNGIQGWSTMSNDSSPASE